MKQKETKFIKDTEELLNWFIDSARVAIESGMHKEFDKPIDLLFVLLTEIATVDAETGDAVAFKENLVKSDAMPTISVDKSKMH